MLFLIYQLIQLGNVVRTGRNLMLRLLCVHIYRNRRLLDRLHRACAGDTAARARHALEQIAVILARKESVTPFTSCTSSGSGSLFSSSENTV